MIDYLISSTICMALVIGLYQLLLSNEAMYQFNRFYLLFGLLASFIIPLITIEWGVGVMNKYVFEASSEPIEIDAIVPIVGDQISASSTSYFDLFWGLYLLIAVGLLMRFVYNLTRLYFKISRNKKVELNSNYGVLLPEEIVPYAFWNFIFINEKEYTEGRLEPELIRHETAHANEMHSLDVIIVEIMQIVLWFNPLIYSFKRAIQLNHEFIADRYVLDQNYNIQSYQHLLLDKISLSSEMSLVSNLNFYFTKQRLEMMTKNTSILRSYAYSGVVAILFICLTLGFAKTEAQSTNGVELSPEENLSKDSYFKNATFKFTDDHGQEVFASYSALSERQQQLLPPPPPRPDGQEHKPLEEGTVVTIDGENIRLSKEGWVPPPPPPPAPKTPPRAPDAPGSVMAPPAPPAPPQLDAPPAPPAPPVPPSPTEYINEMIQAGATFYMNDKKVSSEDVQLMTNKSDFKGSIRTKKVGGKYQVHLKQ